MHRIGMRSERRSLRWATFTSATSMFGCMGWLRILMTESHSVRRAHYCAVRLTRSPLASCSPDLLASRPAWQPLRRGDAKGGCTRGSGFTRGRGSPRTSAMTSADSPRWYDNCQPRLPACSCACAATSSCPKECWSTSSDHQPFESLARTPKARQSPQRRPSGAPCRNPAAASAPARRTGQPNRPSSGH